MSQTMTVSDGLTELAALVKAGDIRAAKHHARTLLDTADAESLSIISRCAATLQNYPHDIALDKLRNAWCRASDEHKPLIAACAPDHDTGQYRPDTQPDTPHRYGRDLYRAPRNSHTRHDPTRRTPPRTAHQAQQEATAARYHHDSAGVPDGPQLPDPHDRGRDSQPYASGIDYDKAGTHDLRGLPCVFCWLERAAADTATDRFRAGHGDDGLCTECRDLGRTGIPELPTGHTLADAVAARCTHIATRTGTAARGILAREWKRAGRGTPRRTLIEQWVTHHPLTPPTTNPTTPDTDTPTTDTSHTPTSACTNCPSTRQIRHGLCLDCRTLDTPTPHAA